ncbi:MAG: hypothetical protein M0Q38_02790 [Bacteroidales bacterium]|jgi:hypothetical protein|nr:hypothetical protein [Bacteroidales bacterium]
MKFNILIVLSWLLIVFSCKKDQSTPEQNIPKGEFVSGKFGSDSFTFIYPFYNDTNLPDTLSNVAYSFGFISIHRNNAKIPTQGIALYFLDSWLDSLPLNKPLPYCELQLLNFNCNSDTTFGPNDSCNYTCSSISQPLDIRITNKKDDTLTGTFSGVIRTRTGLSKEVTDGRFRIKIIRKQDQLKSPSHK